MRGYWFSFAVLLESARRLDIKVLGRFGVRVNPFFVKGISMKYSVLLAALLAVSMTACGKKEEAAAPAPAPEAAAPAPAPAPEAAAPAPAPAPEAAAPAAPAAPAEGMAPAAPAEGMKK
jgi:hypothetical protein